MTNSNDQFHPDRVIDAVFELLDESHLAKVIDDPVQKAAAEFDYRSPETEPYFRFVDITSRFFGHIYKMVGTFCEKVTHCYAQQELMDLLEKKYRTPQGSGFHLAYLDAMEDLDPVLSCISGIIIVQLRERHVQWIYRKWIAGLDWNKKCVLINTLLDRMPSLPTNLQRCHPSQLTDHVFELISTMVSANTTVRSTLTGDAALFGE